MAVANHSQHNMNLNEFTAALRRVKYSQSTQSQIKLPDDHGFEWAFMGRSNAGKSSLLNSLTGVRIARTSKTPGRTQCMNVFEISEQHRIIDFPGYGFAKVNKQQVDKWQVMIERYLFERQSLCGICIIMDIRHIGLKTDLDFLNLACNIQIPIRIVLNKADKLSKNQAAQACIQMQKLCQVFDHQNISVGQYSTLKTIGKEELIAWLHSCPVDTSM